VPIFCFFRPSRAPFDEVGQPIRHHGENAASLERVDPPFLEPAG
jgi:hypothetical protein